MTLNSGLFNSKHVKPKMFFITSKEKHLVEIKRSAALMSKEAFLFVALKFAVKSHRIHVVLPKPTFFVHLNNCPYPLKKEREEKSTRRDATCVEPSVFNRVQELL